MAYNSEEEMVPDGLEVAHAIVEFLVPGIHVSAGANSYSEYGLIAIEYTVHTINVCLVWPSLFSARPPPLP